MPLNQETRSIGHEHRYCISAVSDVGVGLSHCNCITLVDYPKYTWCF